MEKNSFLFDEFETFLKKDNIETDRYEEDKFRSYENQNEIKVDRKSRSGSRSPVLSSTYVDKQSLNSEVRQKEQINSRTPRSSLENHNGLHTIQNQLEEDGIVSPQIDRDRFKFTNEKIQIEKQINIPKININSTNNSEKTPILISTPYLHQLRTSLPSPSITIEKEISSASEKSDEAPTITMDEKFEIDLGRKSLIKQIIPSPSVISHLDSPFQKDIHPYEDEVHTSDDLDKELNDIKIRWINKETTLQDKEFQLRKLEKKLEKENQNILEEKERVASIVKRLEESDRKRRQKLEYLQEREKILEERESKLQFRKEEQEKIEHLFELKVAKAEQYFLEEKSKLKIEKERVQFEKDKIASERDTLQLDQKHLENTFKDLRKAEAECKQSFHSLKEEQEQISKKMNEIQNRETILHEREIACREAEASYKETLNRSFEIAEFNRNLKRIEQERKLLDKREKELNSKEHRILQQNASLQNEIRRMEMLQRDIIREKEYIREQRRSSHHFFSPQLNIDEDLNRSERIRSWIRSLEKSVEH